MQQDHMQVDDAHQQLLNPPLLPSLRIQSDWEVDMKADSRSSFWATYTSGGNQSQTIHGRVVVFGSSDGLHCEGEDGIQVLNYDKSKNRAWIEVAPASNHNFSCRFHSSTRVFDNIHNKKCINDVDLSPQGELGVSASDDGLLKVWDARTGSVMRHFIGHVGDVLTCRFFPSGQVILSGGSDTQLKIWSALDGECAATCVGHSGGILGVDFIDRGRNIISCSRDGSAKLWEVASQSIIKTFYKSNRAINGCHVCQQTNTIPTDRKLDPKESGTDNKLVLLACEDKSLTGIDLRSQTDVFRVPASAAVNCCTALNDRFYIAGDDNGIVYHWDSQNLSQPINVIKRSSSPIKSIRTGPIPGQYWVSSEDGSAYLWDIQSSRAVTDLTGSDFEPVNAVVGRGSSACTGARDGKIRKYEL